MLAEEIEMLKTFKHQFAEYSKSPGRSGHDVQRSALSAAGGPVTAIIERRGRLIPVVRGTRGEERANIGSDWAWFTEGRDGVEPVMVIDLCNLLIGEIQDEHRLAVAKEKTFAYKIARALSLPSRVREAMGYEAKTGKGRAVSLTVLVLMTIITGLPTGLLIAWIAHLMGWNA